MRRAQARARSRGARAAPASASAWTATGWRPTTWCWPARPTAARACWPALDARLAELLGTVPYSSSMTVALGFDAARFRRARPTGFGFLVPKKERRRLVACTWVGTKFSYRVPEGKVVARCFLGGMEDAGVLDETGRRHRSPPCCDELREIAGVTAQPRFTRISRWPRSMAQYTVGHPQRAGGNRGARGRRSRACTWPATPTTASASPTASAWAARQPKIAGA